MSSFKFRNEKEFFENKYEGIAQLLAAEEFIIKLEKLYESDSMGFKNFVFLVGGNVDISIENMKNYKERIKLLIDDYFPF